MSETHDNFYNHLYNLDRFEVREPCKKGEHEWVPDGFHIECVKCHHGFDIEEIIKLIENLEGNQ